METIPKLLEANASYQSSLATPRLTPLQIADVVQSYLRALKRIFVRQYQIQLTARLPKNTAVKVLEMIPNFWADSKKTEMLRRPTALGTQQIFLEANKSIRPANTSDQETQINVSGLDMLVNLALRHAQQTQQLYNRYMQVGEELTEIRAAVSVYFQIEKAIMESGESIVKSGMNEEQMLGRIIAQENAYLEKVKQTREKLLASYRNTQFFLPNSPVGQRKESTWLFCNSRDYLHVGLFWLTCCLAYVACLELKNSLSPDISGRDISRVDVCEMFPCVVP